MNSLSDLIIDEETVDTATASRELPELGLIEQQWETDPVPPAELADKSAKAVRTLDFSEIPLGGEIAVGVGSRGIANLSEIVSGVIAELDDQGYAPFVVPAMGSHGGATAAGQREVLETLDITEAEIGCEIRATMNVVEVGRTPKRDVPVFTDAHAAEADGILPVNRVKPHTDYDGSIESGLAKMLVIGFGKQRGAKTAHDWAIDWSLREMVPDIAARLVDTLPVIGGVAILEDQRDDTAEIECVPATSILEREQTLLARAEELLPRLPFEELDLLVVDRPGKNVSGQGIDPNVIGRRPFAINEPEPDIPSIKRIYVRSLTDDTHGNAMGVGSADYIHQDILRNIEATDTFVNAITASTIRGIRIPPVLESDRAAIRASLSSIGASASRDVRMMRVTDTMRLETVYASPPLIDQARERDDLHVLADPSPIDFDRNGDVRAKSPDIH